MRAALTDADGNAFEVEADPILPDPVVVVEYPDGFADAVRRLSGEIRMDGNTGILLLDGQELRVLTEAEIAMIRRGPVPMSCGYEPVQRLADALRGSASAALDTAASFRRLDAATRRLCPPPPTFDDSARWHTAAPPSTTRIPCSPCPPEVWRRVAANDDRQARRNARRLREWRGMR